jgi:hypothetical protein
VEEEEITMRGSALFDPVKFQYFKRLEETLNRYQDCVRDISQRSVPAKTYEFVSYVISLYIEIEPKLDFSEAIRKQLLPLEKYIETGEYEPIYQLDQKTFPNVKNEKERKIIALFLEFSQYFSIIRIFFEQNGITQYEKQKFRLKEQLIRARAND